VSNLEIEVDALQSRFEAWTLRAAQEADDPVSLRGLIHLGVATEEISDAALEITEGVMRDIGVHPSWRWRSKSPTDHHPDRDRRGEQPRRHPDRERNPATDISTSVIAIRRPDEGWLVGHDIDTTLRAGDAVLSKGTRTSAEEFEALAA